MKCVWLTHVNYTSFFFFFTDFIYLFIFSERGREGEREGEKHQCVVASHTPPTGDLATTQACALPGNQTCHPLVLRLALNPLDPHQPGPIVHLFITSQRFR